VTIQSEVEVLLKGLGIVGVGAIGFGLILLAFVGLPSYVYGEIGAVVGVGVFTLLVWSYILGLYSQL
jgi:hypothetical protein